MSIRPSAEEIEKLKILPKEMKKILTKKSGMYSNFLG